MDLEKKSKAIKMTWIVKLFDENCPGKFKHTMIEILIQYKEANFGKNVFNLFLYQYYIRQLPQFYSKLLITWANFLQDRQCKPTTIGQILTEPLFDNGFLPTVKSEGKQLTFLSDWCQAEITEIQDLTYGVIPCEAIKELLTKLTKQTEKQHVMYLNSIPKDWLQILKTEIAKPDENFSIELTPDTKPKLVTELTGRWLYTALLLDEARSTEHSYRQAWGTTFGLINWENTFENIQKNNFDCKANDLRWKILHRCLPTAKRLAGWSPFFASSTCQVCKKHEENLTHLFFLRPSAKKIWYVIFKIMMN